MRIAVVETDPYGGLLHYAFQLADALARRGNDVDLITPRDNELVGLPTAARMRAVLTPKLSTSEPARGARRLARRASVAVRLAWAWGRIIWVARRGGYDVIVLSSTIQTPPTAAGALALTTVVRGTPIAHVCHNATPAGPASGGEWRFGPLTDRLLRVTYSRLRPIFVHGERSRAEFEQAWGPNHMAIIPHGDERIFGADPLAPATEESVLFFGNWDRYKGIEVLIDAFDLLASRRPQATLTIAGSAVDPEVDVDAIRRWAQTRERVELNEGYVPLADVPAVFGRARVVALPYVGVFQSGVAHLAMTLGRAVVATDVGDISSAVIDGETGLLVPPEDAEALARALERVISDPALAEHLGAEGRNRVLSGSSWESVAERVEAELDAVT
jgi:glycosyltransferase involved in cell wall biosynthesis